MNETTNTPTLERAAGPGPSGSACSGGFYSPELLEEYEALAAEALRPGASARVIKRYLLLSEAIQSVAHSPVSRTKT